MVEEAEAHADEARLAALALLDTFWSRR
jgi:hypothetical protein